MGSYCPCRVAAAGGISSPRERAAASAAISRTGCELCSGATVEACLAAHTALRVVRFGHSGALRGGTLAGSPAGRGSPECMLKCHAASRSSAAESAWRARDDAQHSRGGLSVTSLH